MPSVLVVDLICYPKTEDYAIYAIQFNFRNIILRTFHWYAIQDFSHDFDYEKLAKAWSADPRFDALERKDREILLNER